MTESGGGALRSPEASTPKPSASMMPVMRGVLLDIAPPLIAYYGLRAAGTSEYVALLSATVLSGSRVVYGAMRTRRIDPFAGYLLLTFGLSLAVGLATTDPKLLLAGNTLVNGFGGLVFLGSCVIGTPLTQVVAARTRPTSEQHRQVHVLLSAMWGTGLLLEVAVRLIVISRLSVDAANGVTTAISLSTTGLLILATIVVARRASAWWAMPG